MYSSGFGKSRPKVPDGQSECLDSVSGISTRTQTFNNTQRD